MLHEKSSGHQEMAVIYDMDMLDTGLLSFGQGAGVFWQSDIPGQLLGWRWEDVMDGYFEPFQQGLI
jgi:hypothetical protein